MNFKSGIYTNPCFFIPNKMDSIRGYFIKVLCFYVYNFDDDLIFCGILILEYYNY
ncbi:hypothetical protein LEP1GSC132_1225 [Leptospira kirschneri str. 200803703]|uniref:Uncharacterized protein n=1 Tax=Leptospira kirschneri str. 200802841 TaxID=1193047 RepID=A0A828XYC9_9LEPT|nr:hypothetical protein LEP1GSC131_4401 [Leptospira kirschneri str. 200802841]EMK14901.1 hypothetical protein LEP1GSC042_0700 [Leptospira kirschneri serovar Bim str. PUO 1247]EMN05581.1 hypothetical protein LEP1GSC046_2899 [Leptospira kirschneri serovar Bim str. 1051]EMN27747.1 hypothetical protein LEP1GSC065_0547 [Leptospira kirschneri serovar Sokoine str. RM1]EMO68217.1 hypothetical protein LEP1GSC132_1225 [Leptospira kirschneri str. 200803703]EMO75860.1 hypothetical protein LEP1GSC127_4302 